MSDETTSMDRSPYVALRCSNCGAGLRALAGQEGTKCPSCHSTDVRTLVAPGGAVDYAVADRRHGTTAADVMFAEWAKWCGYVTPNQYNAAMHRQNSELQTAGSARPIHEVMASLGSLDEERAVGLLRFLSRKRPDSDDRDFVARLLRRGAAGPAELKEVARLQAKTARDRNEVPPIGQLLAQRRLITEAQLLEVLREQAADGMGSLHTALAMSQPPPKETVAGKIARRAVESRSLIRGIAVAVILGLLAAGVWAWRLKEEPLFVYAWCRECKGIVQVEWTATNWPARCPRCKARAAYFAVKCPKGHVFDRAFPFTHEKCPECGADRGRPLTEQDYALPGRR